MKIGIDLDDVLADSLPHYLQAFNERFGLDVSLLMVLGGSPTGFPRFPGKRPTTFSRN